MLGVEHLQHRVATKLETTKFSTTDEGQAGAFKSTVQHVVFSRFVVERDFVTGFDGFSSVKIIQ
jgi:hypothetical protein